MLQLADSSLPLVLSHLVSVIHKTNLPDCLYYSVKPTFTSHTDFLCVKSIDLCHIYIFSI
uniref:Uncharacterized protein n=1 Tax=Anguilla anguilla TaxID=7936 RepID=A0A0E9WVH0_ANGAN